MLYKYYEVIKRMKKTYKNNKFGTIKFLRTKQTTSK